MLDQASPTGDSVCPKLLYISICLRHNLIRAEQTLNHVEPQNHIMFCHRLLKHDDGETGKEMICDWLVRSVCVCVRASVHMPEADSCNKESSPAADKTMLNS